MANRYWVGGAASWDATAGSKWALTSAGAGGQAVPTTSDDVFFDAASGAVTVTVAASASSANLNFTGFTGTFAGSSALQCAGSFTLSTGMTLTYNGNLTFSATTTGKTLTFNGKSTGSVVTFNGVGGEWTMQDAWTNTSSITLTAGSLITNGNTLTNAISTFSISGTTTRALTLNSSSFLGRWTATTTTNLTFNSGTSSITWSGGAAFAGGGLTYYDLTAAITSAQDISGNNIFHNYLNNTTSSGVPTFTGSNTFNRFSSDSGRVNTFTAGTTQTVASMAVDGSTLQSTGAAYNIVSTGADIVFNNVTISNCHASGANFTAYNSVDGGGNTGITFFGSSRGSNIQNYKFFY